MKGIVGILVVLVVVLSGLVVYQMKSTGPMSGQGKYDDFVHTRGPGKKLDNWGKAMGKWYDPNGPVDTSLYKWLYNEAVLVCNTYSQLKAYDDAHQELSFGLTDPLDFCTATGSDPAKPPPLPQCDWGSCPDS